MFYYCFLRFVSRRKKYYAFGLGELNYRHNSRGFLFFTKQAVPAIILAVFIDVLGFVPTFRKSYLKPYEEPALTYSFSALGYSLSIGGIGSYNFVTMLNPVALAIINTAFVIFLLVRRKRLLS